jgi:DNA-binding beta-propeller fold protein YncE
MPSSKPSWFSFLMFMFSLWVVLQTAGCARRMLPPKTFLGFVAIKEGHCLAVVDLGNFKFIRSIPLGFAPYRIVVRPHSYDLLIISETGDIGVVRYPDLNVVTSLRTGSSHVSVCFSGDGRRGYAVGAGQHDILVLAGDPPQILRRYFVKPAISRLAVTPDGNTLLAEAIGHDQLLFINTQDGRILGAVPLGQDPGQMVILPNSAKVFIADPGENAVYADDIQTRQMLSQIEIGSAPSLLALKPDGGEIFAISSASSNITLLDASSDSVEQALPAGSDPVAAVFSNDSSAAYVANEGDGTVVTLAVQNRETIASTRIGVKPVALALTPDQRFLAVADAGAGSIAIMRARVPMLITTIPVGGNPVDVAIPGWLWSASTGYPRLLQSSR